MKLLFLCSTIVCQDLVDELDLSLFETTPSPFFDFKAQSTESLDWLNELTTESLNWLNGELGAVTTESWILPELFTTESAVFTNEIPLFSTEGYNLDTTIDTDIEIEQTTTSLPLILVNNSTATLTEKATTTSVTVKNTTVTVTEKNTETTGFPLIGFNGDVEETTPYMFALFTTDSYEEITVSFFYLISDL